MRSSATSKTAAKKHNGIISFWKFAFIMMIAIHHECLTYTGDNPILLNYARYGGVIGVTFFFVVSGFLMTRSALKADVDPKQLGQSTWQYLFKKIKRFFPYVLLTYAVLLIMGLITGKYNTTQAINSVWNLSFLNMSGIQFTRIIDILWYISAMLICMLIFYPLIVKYKRNFLLLVCPVLAIFMAGYLSQKYNGLATIYQYNGILYDGMIRAAVCMLCGSFSYLLSEKLASLKLKKTATTFLTVFEVLGFTSMFFLVGFVKHDYSLLALVILMLCVAVAFSEKTLFLKLCSNKLFFYLEALTLSILFTHRIAIRYLKYPFSTEPNTILEYSWYIIMTLVLAMVVMFVIEKLRQKVIAKNLPRKL